MTPLVLLCTRKLAGNRPDKHALDAREVVLRYLGTDLLVVVVLAHVLQQVTLESTSR